MTADVHNTRQILMDYSHYRVNDHVRTGDVHYLLGILTLVNTFVYLCWI